MTTASMLGVGLSLLFVVALLLLTLRVVRSVGRMGGQGVTKMEVIQRLGLSAKQGIAVVRVGHRIFLVSVGDGGVHQLAELSPEDIGFSDQPPKAPLDVTLFAARLMSGFREARGRVMHLAAFVVTLLSFAGAANAQAPVRRDSSIERGVATAEAIMRSAPQFDVKVPGAKGEQSLHMSGTVGVVVMMAALTLLPMMLLLMTSFTRILIVLGFLRQAIGAQAPPAMLVTAMSLLLTGFVMGPTIAEANRTALTPWLDGKMSQSEMMGAAIVPFRGFMLRQTRPHDLDVFINMSRAERPKTVEEVPTTVLMSAFVTSELRTAFQIGFALFLPFIIIDLVVSSVLMSMGMMMLPPAMVSLPFKLVLFVLVDGWSLVIQSVVASFR